LSSASTKLSISPTATVLAGRKVSIRISKSNVSVTVVVS
jgi:hypothetical protein